LLRLPPLLDNVFDNENETSRKHLQRGTALPRIGAFHNNPPMQGQVGTSRDSHQEVSTSWDTRLYPSAPTLIIQVIKQYTHLRNFRIFFKSYTQQTILINIWNDVCIKSFISVWRDTQFKLLFQMIRA
jgi:hypothetical protein